MYDFTVEKIDILLKQHVGAPCKPIVAVGDHVKRGQLVAVPTGLGTNIHSSLTGTVKDITDTKIVLKVRKLRLLLGGRRFGSGRGT